MKAIFVSDLHLTDRPLDEYRWKIFDQLEELCIKHAAKTIYILGDLCEHKDFHSSRLVNRITDSLSQLAQGREVHILKGNHDGLEPTRPYFLFLNKIPAVSFYAAPVWLKQEKDIVLLLPHTRQPEEDWRGIDLHKATHIFIHGTVHGAVSESGQVLQGIDIGLFKGLKACILAGDIHVPQIIGKQVEYIGAPYPIRFGDEFPPRALLVDGSTRTSLPLDNIRKLTLHCTVQALGSEAKKIKPGDQVKAVIELSESELHEFHKLKQDIAAQVSSLGGVLLKVQLVKRASAKPKIKKGAGGHTVATPVEELRTFCQRNGVEEELAVLGEQLLEAT